MGLKNAPSTFQRIINQAMTGITGTECVLYLDDVVIFSHDFESHLVKLCKVLLHLSEHQLLVNPDKSDFLKSQVLFLGHTLTKEGIKLHLEKTSALVGMKSPTGATAVQPLLRLTGYCRRFIEHYADKIKSLTNLLHKGAPFIWTSEAESALRNLIIEVTSLNLILRFPDFKRLFYLHTDKCRHWIYPLAKMWWFLQTSDVKSINMISIRIDTCRYRKESIPNNGIDTIMMVRQLL